MVDEDTPHRERRAAQEVHAVVVRPLALGQDMQPDFVHERRRLQRVVGALAVHAGGRGAVQLGVEERKELVARAGIARGERGEAASHIARLRRTLPGASVAWVGRVLGLVRHTGQDKCGLRHRTWKAHGRHGGHHENG